MKIENLSLEGLKLIKPKVFEDQRGYFLETYQKERYQELGTFFVQDNHSFSKKNTIRGMHFQISPGQAKLVFCPFGKILDVVVDIRKTSKTFQKWFAIYLDDQKHEQLFIPEGFAHGFCVLSEEAHVMYKVNTPYIAEKERCFRWNDEMIGIHWPISKPILSEKDDSAKTFKELFL